MGTTDYIQTVRSRIRALSHMATVHSYKLNHGRSSVRAQNSETAVPPTEPAEKHLVNATICIRSVVGGQVLLWKLLLGEP